MMRFGTDGIRGPAGTAPIDVDGALAVGAAAARLAPTGRVLIACDRRPSGPVLEAGVVAGVARAGGVAVRGGILPTAGASEAVRSGLAEVAVVLTASHNPAEDNGFKLLAAGGRKPTDDEVARIERWLAEDRGTAGFGAVEDRGNEALAAHVSALAKRVDLEALRGHRIGLDLANGAAVRLWPWLASLGIDWVPIATGDGVENADCGAVHPGRLGAAVRAAGARVGLAVDGDADRCVLVDEAGEKVHGDVLGWWLARAGRVRGLAVTVMSTLALEPALPAVDVVRTAVGDRHLQAAMREHGLTMGIEESGHALFEDGLPTGCGLLTGLRALVPLLADSAPVSTQLAAFAPWPRWTGKVRVSARPALSDVPQLVEAQARAEEALGPGRTLLRYSGTEPVLRLLVEGPDAAVVECVAADVLAVAEEVLA